MWRQKNQICLRIRVLMAWSLQLVHDDTAMIISGDVISADQQWTETAFSIVLIHYACKGFLLFGSSKRGCVGAWQSRYWHHLWCSSDGWVLLLGGATCSIFPIIHRATTYVHLISMRNTTLGTNSWVRWPCWLVVAAISVHAHVRRDLSRRMKIRQPLPLLKGCCSL